MEPNRNRYLAELAVETTGLGNVPDKIIKNHRKTLGVMSAVKAAATFGILILQQASTIAAKRGLLAQIVLSTNPAATPANNIINAIKCGNAIVVAPSSPVLAQPVVKN